MIEEESNENLLRREPDDLRFVARQVHERARRLYGRAMQAIEDAWRIRREAAMARAQLTAAWVAERRAAAAQAGRALSASERRSLLESLLDTAIRLAHADMGNVQLVDPASGALDIEAQLGFSRPFLTYFGRVQGATACHAALKRGVPIVVPDVTESAIFRGTPGLEVLLDAGARAVESFPLISRSGRVLGVFSTHFRRPAIPERPESGAFEFVVRKFVQLLESDDTPLPS